MVGDIIMRVHCFSDSYIGFDKQTEVRFSIKQTSTSRVMYQYHEDDVKRDPTLFEQVMQGLNEENSDDDLEEEEETKESFDSKKNTAKIQDNDKEETSKED